jgi:hypothetical protein
MPSWLTKPETVYATALFVLSVLVSMFAGEIKQFFRNSPLKVAEKTIAINSQELATLQRLHLSIGYDPTFDSRALSRTSLVSYLPPFQPTGRMAPGGWFCRWLDVSSSCIATHYNVL